MNRSHSAARRWAWTCGALLLTITCAWADTQEYTLEIRDHLFYPMRLTIPRNQKVKLIVINRDATPEEFESYELNREKVIMGGRQSILFVGPLPPGEYPFFGEYHPKTALGTIVVE
ncbi:MAG: cupredoxin domain-containing protein [Spongiibacteraceae bacterium]